MTDQLRSVCLAVHTYDGPIYYGESLEFVLQFGHLFRIEGFSVHLDYIDDVLIPHVGEGAVRARTIMERSLRPPAIEIGNPFKFRMQSVRKGDSFKPGLELVIKHVGFRNAHDLVKSGTSTILQPERV